MKNLAYILVATLVFLFNTNTLSAQCQPGWTSSGIQFQIAGIDCTFLITYCYFVNTSVTPTVIEVDIMEVTKFGNGCSSYTRNQIVNMGKERIVNQIINQTGLSNLIPPCPSQALIALFKNVPCATAFIYTGIQYQLPDGSWTNGYTSYPCNVEARCWFRYSVCCDAMIGTCPPALPTMTLIGSSTTTVSCGTRRVTSVWSIGGNPPAEWDEPCVPQCTE